MTQSARPVLDDLQASSPEIQLGLSRAGVTGVQKAVRIGRGTREKLILATIDCTVDLDPSQKGVHMSRFPELFEEAIEGVVADEAFLVEDLAAHVAHHIVERQQALRAEVRITARYPYSRRTPVTKLSTQEMVSLIGIAAASRGRVRRIVGVEAVGINACPCAQGLVRGKASERLLEAGFAEGDVDRILELVPIATHNQRGQGSLFVGTSERVDAERLVELVEGSMSSPIYELLKRPDELFVVELRQVVEDALEGDAHRVLDEPRLQMCVLDHEELVGPLEELVDRRAHRALHDLDEPLGVEALRGADEERAAAALVVRREGDELEDPLDVVAVEARLEQPVRGRAADEALRAGAGVDPGRLDADHATDALA